MTEKQRVQQIFKILTPYLGMFANNKIGGDSLVLYAKVLADDYEPDEVNAAMMKLIKTAKFFPRVAEIVEAIDSLRNSVAMASGKNPYPSEGQAWQEVMDNARINHIYKPWSFSNPAVEQAAKQFGKMELINLAPDDMNTARAQFMKIYQSCISREKDHRRNCETLTKLGARHEQLKTLTASIGGLPPILGNTDAHENHEANLGISC